MALNRRGGLDPRWANWGRDVLGGFMPATCIIYNPSAKATSTWEPFADDLHSRMPGPINDNIKVYQGPCRIVQNTGYRARKGQDVVQTVADQSVMIQLDLNGNTLEGFGSPDSWLPIMPGSLVTVTKVAGVGGRAQSNAITQFDYYVRLVDEASSRMTKDLVCDIIPQAMGGPRGNL